MMIIQEAYYQKAPKCIEMEKCVQELRQKYGDENKGILGGRGIGSIEQSAPWQRWRELFEEQFGFESVTLVLMRSEIPNAMTLPITWTFDGVAEAKNKIETTKYGMRYKKSAGFCTVIFITEAMLFHPSLTPAQIVAVLLHEVGHNFDSSIYTFVTGIRFIGMIFEAINSIRSLDITNAIVVLTSLVGIRRGASKAVNSIMQTSLWNIYDVLKWVSTIPSTILIKALYPVFNMIGLTLGGISAIAQYPLGFVLSLYNTYSAEQFSDRFAAMHGYGPELVEGLKVFEKMEIGSEAILNRIPVLGHIYGLYCVGFGMIGKMAEPHPEYAARVAAVADQLNTEIEKSKLDKKTKDHLKNDIKRLNAAIEQYKKEDVGFAAGIKRSYFEWLLSAYPKNGDIRSILLDDWINAKAIDKGLADALDNPMNKLKLR